jgi:hypothetical protein
MIQGKVQAEKQVAAPLDVVHAIVGLNSEANLALVHRTRRVIRDTAIGLAEERSRRRRNIGFAVLAFLVLALVLAPAIWNGVEDLLGGEHFADLPTQITFLLLMLFPTMLAALIAGWKGHRDAEDRREL